MLMMMMMVMMLRASDIFSCKNEEKKTEWEKEEKTSVSKTETTYE